MGCDIYLSANAMAFKTQSRKDDLISMMYSLVYLVNETTDWAYEHITDIEEQRDCIYKFKKNATPEDICSGEAYALTPILKMIYNLRYDEDPNYEKIVFEFSKAIMNLDMPPSIKNYDWVRNPNILLDY